MQAQLEDRLPVQGGLARLASPQYYVLSGNDLRWTSTILRNQNSLHGNNPQKIDTYGTVLSLYKPDAKTDQ
ncbi:hypothetical protein CS542_07935 [Pedobacter sp. IW39]|nr:hypothetical protein CS542_07935 [Pedobacter sp. IW39]